MLRQVSMASSAAFIALGAAVLPVSAGLASPHSGSDETRFVVLINDLRTSHGLPSLSPDPALSATSCSWNDHMAHVDVLSHDPNLAAEVAGAEPVWTKAGENVGVGGDVDSLFRAFVNSPEHYRNLVDPAFTRIGVCVTPMPDGIRLYTTHRFVAGSGPSAADQPSPPQPARPELPRAEPTRPQPSRVPDQNAVSSVPMIGSLVPVASKAIAAGVVAAIG